MDIFIFSEFRNAISESVPYQTCRARIRRGMRELEAIRPYIIDTKGIDSIECLRMLVPTGIEEAKRQRGEIVVD